MEAHQDAKSTLRCMKAENILYSPGHYLLSTYLIMCSVYLYIIRYIHFTCINIIKYTYRDTRKYF